MHSYEVVLLLLAVCIALGLLGRWLRMPYPILLVIGGLLISLQPWAPALPPLDPNLVMMFFLPPLLYAAAFNTPWKSFRLQLRAISLLALGLVMFTATVVAFLANWLIGLPLEAGFVLGAIVSPPDAVAALAITQRMKLSKIVTTILEGESLVNDASALVIYRMAVGCVVGGTFSVSEGCQTFFLVSAGGIAVGIVGAWLVLRLHGWLNRTHLADAKLTIAITLLTPFALYFAAEHLHVSGVLAVVTAGLIVGQQCPRVFDPEMIVEARAVWEMVEFVLNSLIFILIGFQLPVVLGQLGDRYSPGELALFASSISAAVIGARIVWVFPGAYIPRWFDRQLFGEAAPAPRWQNVAVVAWTGMRGVVSLAAALALPQATAEGLPFPGRDLILFITFWVIFATLVGQGLTLPLLIRWLGVEKLTEPESPDDAQIESS
ncbi:Na+/H+ antiporter [Limnoglobus roseus]|uniref:Na+/H+ antiporter n=1 Tax=Limnoglobus roseus TaxID=2598579 RepID=A0A5C1ALY4_9BACT|nr:Na+/H+ antiporter [Limnoglobus roseus]QEL18184.1 Na+/H+ antiporter [Limnoglobus roseus]